MALSGMRGLSVFISDIRNCHNKEQERLRVDKELGNIRTRFKNEKVTRLLPCSSRRLLVSCCLLVVNAFA
jgi:hypothetical protein